jgi:hypothetical protein
MSGSSYNYLCFKTVSELEGDIEMVHAMANRLKQLGHDDAAAATMKIIDSINAINQDVFKLSEVWKAVEWLDSGDWGIESVNTAVAKFSEEK